MNETKNKTVYQSDSNNYVEIKLIGGGAFSNVFLVEEEKTQEK